MIIQHNMAAANTNRQLGITNGNLAKTTEKLSSGYRINRAGDDAAGLSISEKMRGQIRGLEQASTNAQDGISLIQTAEGAMNEIHSIVQRMRELTVQAANDTNVAEDRAAIQAEIDQLTTEIDRIAESTEFNTMKIINGDFAAGTIVDGEYDTENGKFFTLQVGANYSSEILEKDPETGETLEADPDAGIVPSEQVIRFSIGSMRTDQIGSAKLITAESDGRGTIIDPNDPEAEAMEAEEVVKTGETMTLNNLAKIYETDDDGNVITASAADIATNLDILDEALKYVSDERSKLGSVQNRLEHTIANADNTAENLQAAESRIRDVDMAEEMVGYSKDSILQQAAQSMLAQANQSTQGVLALLQ